MVRRGAPQRHTLVLNDVLGLSFCIHTLHRRLWECELCVARAFAIIYLRGNNVTLKRSVVETDVEECSPHHAWAVQENSPFRIEA